MNSISVHGRLCLILACAIILTACSSSTIDQSVAGQVHGNQALILSLLNSQEISNLYFVYGGPKTDFKAENWSPPSGSDFIPIGELNLMMHNVGSSATAGGIFVHGYDPNLITVIAKPGEWPPINNQSRNCAAQVSVVNTGSYNVGYFCSETDSSIAWGGRVVNDNNGNSGVIGTVGGLPIDSWLNDAYKGITGSNTDFFSRLGLFTNDLISCGVVNGEFGCNAQLTNNAFNPNRASYGYLLINLYQPLLDKNCANNCRPFPPKLSSGYALSGVSSDSPQGDALYYDYYIMLDRNKWNPLLNDMPQDFQITACYLYTTTVTPSICINPDPTSAVGNQPCTTAPINFKDSQGAPIMVTRIEQQPRPGGTAFTIYIQQVGDGEVWLPEGFDYCSPWGPRPDLRTTDAVQLLDARVTGDLQQLSCLPTSDTQRIVRLQNGKGQITCTYPITGPAANSHAAYLSALTLEFGYVYQNSVDQQIVIHRT